MPMTDIVMPRISDSMTEGTVVRWLKSPGDPVRRGEPLVEIETDKATITYESDVDGVLTHYTVGEGQTVAVGTPIAYVEAQAAPQQQPAPAQPQPQAQPEPQSSPPPLPIPGEYDVFEDSGAQPGPLPVHHDVTEEFPVDEQFQQTGDYGQTGEYAQTGDYEEVSSPHDIYTQEADEFSGAGAAEDRVKASPIARRLARKLGVNIAAIQGSGPGGRVVM
jgi:pyruvate/2-oxoglutarate dehydrogenase complex dihydrolipoamide acyltransferase (E2) component